MPSENVVIHDCTMKDGHGGVVIGSEISGGARNIFASDCYMDSPNLNRALRIKSNSIRGGTIENVYLKNITVGTVSDAAVRVNFYYGEGDIADFTPIVRNIEVRNMTCEHTNYALSLQAYTRSPVSDMRLIDCTFHDARNNNILSHIRNLGLDNVMINDTEYHKILEPENDQGTSIGQNYNEEALPSSIQLMQNFPNPFNNRTIIRYYITRKENVTLTLYNLKGQRIRIMVNETQNPGSYSIPLNTPDLAAGLYIYRLQTGVSTVQRKCIFIK